MSIINFIYQNKKYPIDFKLLKSHSKYFLLKKDIEVKKEESLFLVDEFNFQCDLTEESINEFLLFFKNEDITITNENIFQIKYLSHKYEVSRLIEEADKYINNNYNSLIDGFLNIYSQNLAQKGQLLSNHFQEELISYHMSEYLNDDRLPKLPLNILYRIVSKFLNQIQINDDENKVKKIVDFIIKCIKHHGVVVTNLFNFIELGNDEIEYLIEKVDTEKDQLDINTNFLQKKIIRFLCNKNRENNKEKIKMKNEFENKIEKIQEENNLKFLELQEMIIKMKNEFNYEINKMKENYEQKIDDIKTEEFFKHQEIVKNSQKYITEMKEEIKNIYDKQIEELQKINEKLGLYAIDEMAYNFFCCGV